MKVESFEDMLQLQKLCVEKIKDSLEIAERKLGAKLPMPLVRFNLTGTTAGRAWSHPNPKNNVIQLNPVIMRLQPDEFLARTLAHEVGHLVAHVLHTGYIKPHGKEWQNVAKALGIEPTPCHNYDTDPRAKPKKRAQTYEHNGSLITPCKVGKIIEF